MARPSVIPEGLMAGALLHFEKGVPIDDCDIRAEHKRRLARVDHVYWIWKQNPFLDVFPLFKQLVKGKYADLQSEWRAAPKDKLLFDFVVEHVSPPNRRVAEARVRMAANRLREMGMQTAGTSQRARRSPSSSTSSTSRRTSRGTCRRWHSFRASS